MKTIIRISLVALLLTACGCTKDALNELPPATQTGANTFGCKINGVVYKTLVKWEYSMVTLPEGVKTIFEDGEMFIMADCIRPNIGTVSFTFDYDGKLGKYTNIKGVKKASNSYVNITKFEDGIISGTFNITKYAPEYFGGDTITTYYTEGRFDIETNTNISFD